MWGGTCRWLTLTLLVCAASCAQPAPPNVAVERRDLSIEILADGSARVRDALIVGATDAPIDTFRRFIPAVRTDGLSEIGVERVPGAGGRQEFVITYRAAAVLFRSGHRGQLTWPIAPLTAATQVPATKVTLTLPEGVSLYDGPRVEGTGWRASEPARVTTFQIDDASAGAPATLVAEFSVDTFSIPEPKWQRQADRSFELMPSWISSGLFILISGWGALFMLRLHYRSTPPADADARAAEQASVARGLRVAGVSIVLFGLLCTAAVPWLLASFGSWPYVLPASIVVVGLWLIVAGKRFRIAPPEGSIEPARGGQ